MVEDGGDREPELIPPAPGAGVPGDDERPPSGEPGSAVDGSALEGSSEAAAPPEAEQPPVAQPAPWSWTPAPPPIAAEPGASPTPTEPPVYPAAEGPPASPVESGPAPYYQPQPGHPSGWPPAPGGWPTTPYPTTDTAGWYWCPTHLIASEKEGSCPTCGQPYQPAPPWGIPAGPYRPRVSITQRSRREKLAYVAAGLVLVALALGAVFGLTALYRHGTPLDSNGQPVTSDAVASGSGSAVSSSGDSNNSRLQLRSLEGKNLVLSGHWTQTTQIYRVMIDLARSLTSDNSQPPLDIAATKGTTTVAVFNVPSTNPSSTISDHTQATSVSSSDTGGVVNIAASQNVTIDGKASNYTDITSTDTTGKTVLALRIFFIPTTNHVVMVAVGTRDTRDDIEAVSQALQTLQ